MLSLIVPFLASIPSPEKNNIEIGPLNIRYYGLMIGLGVILGIYIATQRWVKLGGDSDDISYVAMFAIPAGLFGTKVYHVITSPEGKTFVDIFKIWEPGLGIPGGLLFGFLAGWWATRIKGLSVSKFLHAVVPAIPLAQAIGRLGNWFNQELFGRPTDVAWGLEISEGTRLGLANQYESFVPYVEFTTFHPTFLYEMIWNLGLFGVLLFLDSKDKIKKWQMLPAYILGYGLGRWIVESYRIDHANEILGFRVNSVVSFTAILVGIGLLAYTRSLSKSSEAVLEEDSNEDEEVAEESFVSED